MIEPGLELLGELFREVLDHLFVDPSFRRVTACHLHLIHQKVHLLSHHVRKSPLQDLKPSVKVILLLLLLHLQLLDHLLRYCVLGLLRNLLFYYYFLGLFS